MCTLFFFSGTGRVYLINNCNVYLFEYEHARTQWQPIHLMRYYYDLLQAYSFVFTTRAGDIIIKHTYYKMCDLP